ncbi:hypothetical protein ABKV19_017701 [Rosa sericea]
MGYSIWEIVKAFIDDHFEFAVNLYTQAITVYSNNSELYSDRAQANIKSNNLTGLCVIGLPTMGKSPAKWIKTVLFGKKSSKPNISKGRERFVNEKEVVVAARAATTEFVADPPVAFHESTNTPDNNKGLELETRKLQVHLVIESQEAKVQIHKALHYKMQCMILKKSGKSKLQQRHRLPLEDGRHGKAWGVVHKEGLPAADAPKKISRVHKRGWRYIPSLSKSTESVPSGSKPTETAPATPEVQPA